MNRSTINNAIVYLKPIIKEDDEEVIELSNDDSLVERQFNEDLVIFYV